MDRLERVRTCALVYRAPELLTGPVRDRLLSAHQAANATRYAISFGHGAAVHGPLTVAEVVVVRADGHARNAEAAAILIHLLRQIERSDLQLAFSAPAASK